MADVGDEHRRLPQPTSRTRAHELVRVRPVGEGDLAPPGARALIDPPGAPMPFHPRQAVPCRSTHAIVRPLFRTAALERSRRAGKWQCPHKADRAAGHQPGATAKERGAWWSIGGSGGQRLAAPSTGQIRLTHGPSIWGQLPPNAPLLAKLGGQRTKKLLCHNNFSLG